MKILKDSEYQKLVDMANGNDEVRKLKEDVAAKEKRINEIYGENYREVSNLKKDQEVLLKRKDAEVEAKVMNATKSLTEQVTKLTIERDNYKQKVDILEAAFKNLGFDVKDMKAILNKLVDGIISKNTVQLVK